jgi:hypothetical protein
VVLEVIDVGLGEWVLRGRHVRKGLLESRLSNFLKGGRYLYSVIVSLQGKNYNVNPRGKMLRGKKVEGTKDAARYERPIQFIST